MILTSGGLNLVYQYLDPHRGDRDTPALACVAFDAITTAHR
ncbi:MAG: hypothetical protein U0235_02830 [Polyangiaceae bacterium]